MSSRQQPRSRSSCVRQDSAEASGSRTVSLTRMPALFAAVTRFWVAATEEVTRWTLTSKRWPTMPMASRMPSCASTMNSCGRTCRTSRPSGSVMLRAAATARRTSSRSISRGRARTGVRIHDHLPRILQIDRLHAAGIRLPLRKIINQHFVFAAELTGAEVNRHGLRIAGVRQPGHHHAQIFRVGEVDLTHAIRRAGAHEIDILHEFFVRLHALFPLVSRHFFRGAGDDGKMQFFAARTFQDDAMRINQPQFVAVPSKGDRSALRQFNAKAIRQDALHACGFDPGNLFQLAPSSLQRDAQSASIPIMDKLLENRFAADDAIAIHFDLIRLQQQHAGRIQKKLRAIKGRNHAHNAGKNQNQNPPVERPAPPAEFLAANFDRLLAAQVTRLLVGNQLGPVGIGLRRRRIPLYGLHAFQTTTSFSRLMPKLFCTRSRTSAINASMSLAEAWPAFTKKLA